MRTKARVALKRNALDEVQLGLADGVGRFLEEVAQIASARAPDQFEDDKGLPDRWGWAVYSGGKKVADGSGDGSVVKPPREMRISRQDGLAGFVGFGFPARFLEFGTVKMRAQPFLTPAVESVAPRAPGLIREGAAGRLK